MTRTIKTLYTFLTTLSGMHTSTAQIIVRVMGVEWFVRDKFKSLILHCTGMPFFKGSLRAFRS